MKMHWTKYFNPDTILFAISIAFDIWAILGMWISRDFFGRALNFTLFSIAGVMFSLWVFEGVQRHFNNNDIQ